MNNTSNKYSKVEIKEKVIEILTSKIFLTLPLNDYVIEDNSSLNNDLHIDSIQFLELIVCLEKFFKIRLKSKDKDEGGMDSISSIIELIYKLQQ